MERWFANYRHTRRTGALGPHMVIAVLGAGAEPVAQARHSVDLRRSGGEDVQVDIGVQALEEVMPEAFELTDVQSKYVTTASRAGTCDASSAEAGHQQGLAGRAGAVAEDPRAVYRRADCFWPRGPPA
ncbi:hypothetical protein [Nonomuraea africana]|uniref:hypothetical protein n=1 Tax=Nonomuraea africana TaxID=46171 RepID=UPI0033C1524D